MCGQSYGKHGELPDDRCDTRCPGSSTHCGGAFANLVYETWPHGKTKDYVSLGILEQIRFL